MSAIFRAIGWHVVEDMSESERQRIARWNARAGELLEGEISPERFRRLVGSWRPLREMRFEDDPNIVVATLAERREAGEDVFIYEGRRS